MKEKITKENMETLKNNQEFINAVCKYSAALRHLEEVSPKAEAVYNEVLKGFDFRTASGEAITDYDFLYMTDDCTDEFYQAADKALREAGLMEGLKPGYCPKCCAQADLTAVENDLIKLVSQTFDFPEVYSLEMRQKLVSIALQIAGPLF